MDITTFANQLIFPLVLFAIVLYFFHLEPYSINHDDNLKENIGANPNYISELDKFYEIISQDNDLMSQLELIIEQDNYIEQLVNFGKALGYEFTSSDVQQSIAENTTNINSNYICLPIGCWQVN